MKTIEVTQHIRDRIAERKLSFEGVVAAMKSERKFPRHGEPNKWVHIGDEVTVIAEHIGRTVRLVTAYAS